MHPSEQPILIIPVIKVYCCIRWLAGGSYSDLCFFAKISWPSFYRFCWETIAAINRAHELHMKFPATFEDHGSNQGVSLQELWRCHQQLRLGNRWLLHRDAIHASPKVIVGNVRPTFQGITKTSVASSASWRCWRVCSPEEFGPLMFKMQLRCCLLHLVFLFRQKMKTLWCLLFRKFDCWL